MSNEKPFIEALQGKQSWPDEIATTLEQRIQKLTTLCPNCCYDLGTTKTKFWPRFGVYTLTCPGCMHWAVSPLVMIDQVRNHLMLGPWQHPL